MTNKEAIRILQFCMPRNTEAKRQALDLAIKALNTMPFIQDMDNTIDTLKARIKALEQTEIKGDLISREALKKAFKNKGEGVFMLSRVNDIIDNAPTVDKGYQEGGRE